MLRLFSNIRKTLINEGKTSRYVRYAVGEVLLIMVGIILALQFNNWNEGRKLEQDRQELVENLKADFQANLALIEEAFSIGESAKERQVRFLNVAAGDNSHVPLDELKSLAQSLEEGFRYEPTLGSYKAAVSSGSIDLIKSLELKKLFIEFENSNSAFQQHRELAGRAAILGSTWEVRKKLGTIGVLMDQSAGKDIAFTSTQNPAVPTAFELSEQEFRSFIVQKEVYAAYENMFGLTHTKLIYLQKMKDTTKQILTALEELD